MSTIAAREIQAYIALQKANGENYQPDYFDLESASKKCLAPLFMKPYNIPLIDDSSLSSVDNPGIWGLLLAPEFYGDRDYVESRGAEIVPDLLTAIAKIEAYYASDVSEPAKEITPAEKIWRKLQAIFDKLPEKYTTNQGYMAAKKILSDELGGQYLFIFEYVPPGDILERVLKTPSEEFRMFIQLGTNICLNGQVHKTPQENDGFALQSLSWNGVGYLSFRIYSALRDEPRFSENNEFQEELEATVDWLEKLAQPNAIYQEHPYFTPRRLREAGDIRL